MAKKVKAVVTLQIAAGKANPAPPIGPALAQAILDYRAEHGPFTSLQDLDNVPGLGPSKLDALREKILDGKQVVHLGLAARWAQWLLRKREQ